MWFIYAFKLFGHLHTYIFSGVWYVKQFYFFNTCRLYPCWRLCIIVERFIIKPWDDNFYKIKIMLCGIYLQECINELSFTEDIKRARKGRSYRNPIVLSRRFETRPIGQSSAQVSYINDNPFASQKVQITSTPNTEVRHLSSWFMQTYSLCQND